MGASVARKLTRLGPRVLRHQLAQVCASSCLMTCFSCAVIVFRYSKRARTFFTWYVPPEVTLLEIPPCQTPMCGVAYSCSYVLLLVLVATRSCALWSATIRSIESWMNVACACDETRPWSIAKTCSHAVSAHAVDFETKLETSRGVHWQRWTPPPPCVRACIMWYFHSDVLVVKVWLVLGLL